jgi:hypothetical protein
MGRRSLSGKGPGWVGVQGGYIAGPEDGTGKGRDELGRGEHLESWEGGALAQLVSQRQQ